MKIKTLHNSVLLKVILLLMMLYNTPTIKTEQLTWCWTKSMANEPTYVFDPLKGGINWGYCEKVSTLIPTVSYEVEVETSSIAKSGTE